MSRSQPSQPTYADLEIRILDRQAAGYPVELTLTGRQFPRGFLDSGALPWMASADPAADGERLARWLLADAQVKEAWDKANGLDGYCRIRLRIDASAPELHTVPWELLRRPAGPGATAHDLAASDKTPFSRYLALPSLPGSQIVDERLRVLAAIAAPDNLAKYGLAPIDRAAELEALQAAVGGLPVELTPLTGPCTLPAIEQALRRGYHALHFVGHGIYVEPEGAALYLADDDNAPRPIWATELTAMLARLAGPDNPLQLVFLGSCETAVTSPADAFRGLAPQLLRAGIPAVLAMQDLVPVRTYRAFAQTFYRQLMQHGAVDLAANQARSAILTANLPGASIPVLFSRVPDGKLLAIPGVDESAPAPGPSPYKGLQYFDAGDAADFHGREALTAELVEHLRHHSLLAVVGASGSGKSSLARAGLVHALQTGAALADGSTPPEGSPRWPVHIITPTARPLESLAASLTRDSESVRAAAVLMDDLAQDPRSLHFYVRRLLSKPGAGNRLLLVVDQFEELWTLCKDKAQRKAFVDNLLAAACPEADGGCDPETTSTLVILTLRADFYAQCAEFDALRTALERYQRYIGAMSQEELRRAIEAPAQRTGWELEPGLVDVLLQDVGDEPGALPLLSHALLETWKRRRGRTLTLAGYAASGRVQGAIARTADEVYTRRLTAEQQEIARRIFLDLTELGEGAQDTRRRVPLQELVASEESAAAAVLKVLADARLVTTFQDEVEVAHEALIREWPVLREWLEADRESLHVGRRLAEAASEWQREGEDPEALYRGARLTVALEWAAAHPDALNPLARRFLDASRAEAEEAERAREAARQRELAQAQKLVEAERLRAEEQARFLREVEDALARAERQTRRAQAGELAAYAQTSAAKNTRDPSESLLLANLALRTTWQQDGYVSPNAAHAAVDAIEAAPPWLLTLPPKRHTGNVWSAAFDQTGSYIVTASEDQTARVWDFTSGQELLQLRGHAGSVLSAAYSPDGACIVTASDDQTARVWLLAPSATGDATSGQQRLQLRGHTAGVASAAYSPDGATIVTASGDGTARVWDATSGQELRQMRGHTAGIYSAAYSPDGTRIVTASADRTARVWMLPPDSAADGVELLCLRGHASHVQSAAYSPDGARIVTASNDHTVRIWDAESGQELLSLGGHTAGVNSAAYNPDGAYVVATYTDGMARVWDARSGEEMHFLRGHSAVVWTAVYSPDGRHIVTASADQTARVWDAGSGEELRSLHGHSAGIWSVAFSPDGGRVVTASTDWTARVWDASSGVEMLCLRGHLGPVEKAAYSPNGEQIVTASADQTARVWDARSGKELLSLRGHAAQIWTAAYSPDGARIVTAGSDRTARVWDARSGKELLQLHCPTTVVWSAVFSPDGATIVTAGDEETARIWDAANGQELLQLHGHAGWVRSAAYNAGGTQIVTASDDQTVRIWNARSGEEYHSLRIRSTGVCSAVYSPDGSHLLTANGYDNTASVWRLAAGSAGDAGSSEEVYSLRGHSARVRAAAYSPDGGRIVTAGEDQTARIWLLTAPAAAAAPSGQMLFSWPAHSAPVTSAAYSPDGAHIVTTGSDEQTARIWDARSGVELRTLRGHSARVRTAAYSPDGVHIVTASTDFTARIWDARSGEERLRLRCNSARVQSAAYSPDGARIVTASSDDQTARIWDAHSGEELLSLRGHTTRVWSAAYSPDGALIVTASDDQTARVWDAASGQELLSLRGHTDSVLSAAYSPDGALIVTASADQTARVWDARSGEELLSLRGHTASVLSAAYSPDSARIVTASADQTARVWDAASGQELLSLRGHTASVLSAAYSPDGARIVTASADQTARVWPATIELLLELVESLIQRDPPLLTPDERRRFGLE